MVKSHQRTKRKTATSRTSARATRTTTARFLIRGSGYRELASDDQDVEGRRREVPGTVDGEARRSCDDADVARLVRGGVLDRQQDRIGGHQVPGRDASEG